MLVRLEAKSDKPIYLQIAESIGGRIVDGSMQAGERLPSARALAATLDVNMHTVLRAYSHLESQGLVEMRRGRAGVVVSSAGELREMIRGLVFAARRERLGRDEIADLIDEAWQ